MAMTAREAAWTALQRWRKNGAWSDAALNIVLQNAQLAPRDAALAARICYGTLQNLAAPSFDFFSAAAVEHGVVFPVICDPHKIPSLIPGM